MRTEQWSRRRAPLAAGIAALLGVALFGGFTMGRSGWAAEPESQRQAGRAHVSSAAVAAATAPLAEMESGLVMIGEKMEPSVVSIRVDKTMKSAGFSGGQDFEDMFKGMPGFEGRIPQQFRSAPRQFRVSGAGSGVIVKSDGWILTNDHVVGGADKVTVKLADGREFPGTVRRDYSSDLALVKISASNLVPAEMGDSDRVRVGQWAMAFGSPFELEKTMTLGIISARARQQFIGRGQEARGYWNLLQTDAPINPGNSGGALVDIRGRVIGINVAIESPSGGSVGIGFAIPVNTAKDVMEQLITTGHVTRGFLGVGPKSLSPEDQRRTGVSQGALVDSVSDGSPAAKAGIEPGDVIVRLDGKAVVDEISLRETIARIAPGRTVEIVVHRNGRDHTLRATMETKKDAPLVPQPKDVEKPTGGKLGIRVQDITPDLTKQFNLGASAGAVITDIQDGSAASEAGLHPGDVIIRVNGKAASAAADVTSAVQAAKSGDKLVFTIHRNKMRILVPVDVP